MANTHPELPVVRSTKTVAWSGVLLGIVLAYVLGYFVHRDRQVRLQAAERQSTALANGAARLLGFELRNLQRAMGGIAGDAQQLFRTVPESAPKLLGDAVAGVVERHAELQSIVVIDPEGTAITPGVGLRVPMDARRARQDGDRRLRFGALQRVENQWVLPLLMPMEDGNWIVTRLRVSEIQSILANLDTGRDGVAAVTDSNGTVLARSREAEHYVGRRYPDLIPEQPVQPMTVLTRRSVVDGITRISTRLYLPEYRLYVSAGLGKSETLRDWNYLLLGSLLIYALYWGGFLYLWRHMRRSARAQKRLMHEAARNAEGLRLAQQVGKTGTWLIRQSTQRVEWSEQVSAIFGRSEQRHTASPEEFYALVHPDDRQALQKQFADAWSKQEPFVAEYRILRPDGQIRWISSRGGAVARRDGEVSMTGTVVDITSERQAQARLIETERQFRLLFERNPLPFWVFDSQTLRFLEVNEAAVRHYGYSRDEFLAMTILDIRPPQDSVAVRQSMLDPTPLPEGEVWRHLKKDGSVIDVRVYSAAINYGERPAKLVLAEDVSSTLAYERELSFRASHDATTGLLNLPGLKAWAANHRTAGPFTLVYVQMRGVEPVVDSLGQAVATRLLDTIANRIEGLAHEWGATAFVPAEAFVVALGQHVDVDEAVNELRAAAITPVEQGGSLRTLEAWLGVARFERGFEQSVSHAALAAHIARAEGAACRAFQEEMAEAAGQRLRMIGRIHLALERREFVLNFQPIYRLDEARPAALEALIRWPQPDGGNVPPSQFIPLAEDAGLMQALGDWVMEEAVVCHRRLSEAGWNDLPIAINVSPLQLRRPDFADRLIRALQRSGLPRGALHVEVTESVLLDRPESAMQTMRALQKHGVCTSLDDFGTGFSSMAYLQQLPLDALKIDRTFVRDVAEDERSAAICRALITLGHNLGLTVVAEGVETPEQLDWLRRHHCDQVQGYLLARPMGLERLVQHLAEAIEAESLRR